MPTYREGAVGKVATREVPYLSVSCKSQRLLKENDGLEKKTDLIFVDPMTPSRLMQERGVQVTSNEHTDFQILWFRTALAVFSVLSGGALPLFGSTG